MKILVDARVGWGSGIGRHITNTVPRVALARPAMQFDVLVPSEHLAEAAAEFGALPNLKLIACDIPAFSMAEQVQLPKLGMGYDLTWFTNYWVPLGWRGRYFATVHDLLHLMPDLFPASPIKRALSHQTFAKLARSAAGLSFGSRFSEREFVARYGPVQHSRVHYYGIDHADWAAFDPDQPPAKEKRLLAVGASKAHKNFDLLLAAWKRASVGDHWTLTIITPDTKLRSSVDLESMVSGAGRTEFLTGVSNAELRDLYAKTAIMLTPSLYEGFGLPFMEAMQAGCWVISSTAQSMVEIGEGAFATYVNGRDLAGWVAAIERTCKILDEASFDFVPQQRINMRHALQFNWQRVADSTVSLLDTITTVAAPDGTR